MSAPERLQRILARSGVASRRAAEALIVSGRVTVNGEIVQVLGARADPGRDDIRVDGAPLPDPGHLVLIALHKPAGYVTTRHDEHGRRTVMDLVPAIPGLHPVGRLDFDTSGLLLLTNDGALTLAITHPRHELSKVYLATVAGVPDAEALARIRSGVELEDGWTAPAEASVERVVRGGSVVRLVLHEGRKRQVKRMLAAVGHPVRQLIRISVGPLTLEGLASGAWREVSVKEVESLRSTLCLPGRPSE